ncbi:MAG: alpha-L-fucosidase, partial [Phycisphaerae bacterium]|nr:alpha-L-fucosidase [Phycisphaerae bacterium]
TLYAICLGKAAGAMLIRSLGSNLRLLPGKPQSVELLGGGAVRWMQDESGLRVELPESRPPGVAALRVRY